MLGWRAQHQEKRAKGRGAPRAWKGETATAHKFRMWTIKPTQALQRALPRLGERSLCRIDQHSETSGGLIWLHLPYNVSCLGNTPKLSFVFAAFAQIGCAGGDSLPVTLMSAGVHREVREPLCPRSWEDSLGPRPGGERATVWPQGKPGHPRPLGVQGRGKPPRRRPLG